MDFKIIKETGFDLIFEHYEKTLYIACLSLTAIIWIFTLIWFEEGIYLLIFPISLTIISCIIYSSTNQIAINLVEKRIKFYRHYRVFNLTKMRKNIDFADIQQIYTKAIKFKRGHAYWICLKLKNEKVELLYSTDNQNYFDALMKYVRPYLKHVDNKF